MPVLSLCDQVDLWCYGGSAGWPCLNAQMIERKRYPSDLTDERWALIEPVITAWKAAHPSVSGHQGGYELREIVNAILYECRTGCQWDYLPHDLPPRSAAYYYFARWRDDGTDQAIHDLLRWHAREKKGRKADPSLVVLDTQSVHAASSVPADTTGKDPGKKVPGRKRCLAVDVLGLVVAVVVLAASAPRTPLGSPSGPGRRAGGTVRKALVDQGFKSSVVSYGAAVGMDVQVVERNPADRGFVPQPKRWVVEQTFGILSSTGPGPRLRAPALQLGVARVLGDDRRDGPATDRHVHAIVADHVTAADPGRFLLDKIDAREQALTREAGQAQARIDELAAAPRTRRGDQRPADHRKTLISLAGHNDGQPAAEPAGPPPAVPDHPAYQQILTAFADLRRPLRARDLCLALDLPVAAKNTENIRSKLKRLASRGILVETEPGLFARPRPQPGPQPSSQDPNPTPADEKDINSRNRTVDLLLTMDARCVWEGRAGSRQCSSER